MQGFDCSILGNVTQICVVPSRFFKAFFTPSPPRFIEFVAAHSIAMGFASQGKVA